MTLGVILDALFGWIYAGAVAIDSWKVLFGQFSLIDLWLVYVVIDCTISLIRLKSDDD